jgi:hypothetical protein
MLMSKNGATLYFDGRLASCRSITSSRTGAHYRVVTVYGAIVDAAGNVVADVPSYDLLYDGLEPVYQRCSLRAPVELAVVQRGGRPSLTMIIDEMHIIKAQPQA